MAYQAPRGTHDILPSEIYQWQYLEQIFSELAHLYGYYEIRTPVFEDAELFTRSSGESSDVVSKEMYCFQDRSERNLALKPEGTAGVIRAYLQHQLGEQKQVNRLWYCTPFFRYDRPQKGRQRQAHQLGLELIGSSSPLADLEVIQLTYDFYKNVGLKDIKVQINCIGDLQDRIEYKKILVDYARSFLSEQSETLQVQVHKNPMRLLDSKNPALQEKMKDAPHISEYLSSRSKERFEKITQHLKENSIDFEVQPKLVRGLDYYTDTVFEIHSDNLGAQSSLCGGGRYDNLVEQLGGKPTPCFGVGIGIERLLLVLSERNLKLKQKNIKIFVVAADEKARSKTLETANCLRQKGISALTDIDHKDLKKQIKQASKENVQWAIIIGETELNNNTYTLKDLESGIQKTCSLEELVQTVI